MTDEHAMKVAKVIAEAMGDNFADAFKNKERWIAKRGMSGGRFRDVNEPFQHDYLAAAEAAAAIIAADRAELVERVKVLEGVLKFYADTYCEGAGCAEGGDKLDRAAVRGREHIEEGDAPTDRIRRGRRRTRPNPRRQP